MDDPAESGATPFEASMRSHHELMEQMAGREYWETDPMWVRIGRPILIGAGILLAVAFIVWAVIFLAQNS